MAEAAILSAVEALGVLAIEKVGFLSGVEEQVKWLKAEFKRMQCFLKDASEKQAQNASIRNWISQIRVVAQDAEDVIETFILKFDTPRSSIWRFIYLPKHLYHLNVVGKEIKSIRAKLEDIERSRGSYGIQNLGEMTESSRRPEEGEVERRRQLYPWKKDEHYLVGLEGDVELLLKEAILDQRKGLAVTTIAGMGGIGKSTLAKKVYNHPSVANQFEIRAWVVISSDFRLREMIKILMLQILGPQQEEAKEMDTIEKLPLPMVKKRLYESLEGRRYFIVLDDMWETEHLESLAELFPAGDQGSRLLLTSRNRNITKHARDITNPAHYIHEMKPLDSQNSWELFMKKTFGDNDESKCPKDLVSIGKEILSKCGGLPLAICVVGGLLFKSPSKSKWENVLKDINSHLGTRKSDVLEILELSYRNLSPELKSCFLCLGFFKEDATIRAKRLVHVWIAKGLIQQEGVVETVEEIGWSYLDDLINRNMVQVKDVSIDERVKSCHIHDLLRELSIRKAKEEISFEILREDGNSQSLDKPRHRAVYCSTETFIYSAGKNKYLRSLFFHGGGKSISVKPCYWKSFELLKILDFEDFRLRSLPDTIGELTGLRYLGLRNTRIRKLPRSLGRLKKLEVLDIACVIFTSIGDPVKGVYNVIWEMDSLRHLYMNPDFSMSGLGRIGTLKNIHTLSYIEMTDDVILEHLTQLTSLRILGIYFNGSKFSRFSTLCSLLENLVCLKLRVYDFHGSLDGFGTLRSLTKLKLRDEIITGSRSSITFTDFPPNLSYLTLEYVKLSNGSMQVLEKLPNLLGLKLHGIYSLEEIVVSEKGFPRLKALTLRSMMFLSKLQVGKGGMLELKRLELYDCGNLLERLSEELRSITVFNKCYLFTKLEMLCILGTGN